MNRILGRGGATVLKVGGTICNFASGASEKKFLTPPLSFTWGGHEIDQKTSLSIEITKHTLK